MSSENLPLRNSGVYRNLPTFGPSTKGLKALICGGTGISGFHALRALLDTPARWSTIYLLSRSPLPELMVQLLTEDQKTRIQYVPADLTAGPEAIAENFKGARVKPDYVFFYSFMNTKDGNAMSPNAAEKLVESNVPLFDNFLQALPKADIRPKRILLQTGGKNYGVHIGRTRNPLVESDPQPTHLQPNFYYNQEALLFAFCSAHPEIRYNIIRPCAIIGAVNKTWLNAFTSFAFYAAVQAHKSEPLEFGGDWETWQYPFSHSTAQMTGYLAEWAVLEEKCAKQAFNGQDGSILTFERFFEQLAKWFDVKKGVTLPLPDPERTFNATMTLAGGKDAPLGYGPPQELRRSFSLVDWARQPENKQAWQEIMLASNGQVIDDPFASEEEISQNFGGDFCYLRFATSMDKARKFGFCGYVDTMESVKEMYEELATLGMLPRLKV